MEQSFKAWRHSWKILWELNAANEKLLESLFVANEVCNECMSYCKTEPYIVMQQSCKKKKKILNSGLSWSLSLKVLDPPIFPRSVDI